jgi:hypothetical protein
MWRALRSETKELASPRQPGPGDLNQSAIRGFPRRHWCSPFWTIPKATLPSAPLAGNRAHGKVGLHSGIRGVPAIAPRNTRGRGRDAGRTRPPPASNAIAGQQVGARRNTPGCDPAENHLPHSGNGFPNVRPATRGAPFKKAKMSSSLRFRAHGSCDHCRKDLQLGNAGTSCDRWSRDGRTGCRAWLRVSPFRSEHHAEDSGTPRQLRTRMAESPETYQAGRFHGRFACD